MKYRLIMTLFLLLIIGRLLAGEYGDAFIEIGISARAAAMGSSLGALDTSITAFLYNPAGISQMGRFSTALMYTSVFGLANHNYFGIGFQINQQSRIGINWIRFSVDDIPERPDVIRQILDPAARREYVLALDNRTLNRFNDIENALFITYAQHIHRTVDPGWRYTRFKVQIPWGLSVKLLHKSIYNLSAYGIGLDFGGKLRVRGSDLVEWQRLGYLNFGMIWRDITSTMLYWNSRRQDEIPPSVALSFALEQPVTRFNGKMNLSVEKNFRFDDKIYIGLEWNWRNQLAFRAGYRNQQWSAGMGTRLNILGYLWAVDYAFIGHTDLGASHRIGGVLSL